VLQAPILARDDAIDRFQRSLSSIPNLQTVIVEHFCHAQADQGQESLWSEAKTRPLSKILFRSTANIDSVSYHMPAAACIEIQFATRMAVSSVVKVRHAAPALRASHSIHPGLPPHNPHAPPFTLPSLMPDYLLQALTSNPLKLPCIVADDGSPTQRAGGAASSGHTSHRTWKISHENMLATAAVAQASVMFLSEHVKQRMLQVLRRSKWMLPAFPAACQKQKRVLFLQHSRHRRGSAGSTRAISPTLCQRAESFVPPNTTFLFKQRCLPLLLLSFFTFFSPPHCPSEQAGLRVITDSQCKVRCIAFFAALKHRVALFQTCSRLQSPLSGPVRRRVLPSDGRGPSRTVGQTAQSFPKEGAAGLCAAPFCELHPPQRLPLCCIRSCQ
jgi:hypothetical protein